jgi:hypothetical protein
VDVEGGELSKMVCESTEAAETLLLRSGWASRAGEEDAVVGDALRWEAGLCGGSDAMARSDRGCGCEGVDYKNEKRSACQAMVVEVDRERSVEMCCCCRG